MLGMTWQATLDAALDDIGRRDRERQTALDSIGRLIHRHPELDADTDLTEARLALLR